MRVAKAMLGDTIDLGLYVTDELGEVVAAELERLKETQALERRQVTTRTIATEYSGLVGKFLDPTIDELPGYVPLVTPPEPAQAAAAGSTGGIPASSASQSRGAPVLTVLGDNPARVPRDGAYRDLGVAVSGGRGTVTVRAYVNGGPERAVGSIVVDTSFDRVWHIRYEASDGEGNVGSAERYVLVGDAQMPGAAPAPVQDAGVPGEAASASTTSDTQIAGPPASDTSTSSDTAVPSPTL